MLCYELKAYWYNALILHYSHRQHVRRSKVLGVNAFKIKSNKEFR